MWYWYFIVGLACFVAGGLWCPDPRAFWQSTEKRIRALEDKILGLKLKL